VNPASTFTFDYLRNKSGRIWHCRIPAAQLGAARYYVYSASGSGPEFDAQKQLLDPYANCIFFPESFDRTLAMERGRNAGSAALAVIPPAAPREERLREAARTAVHHESDAVIYELHVRGFTKHHSSGVDASRAGMFDGVVDKIPYLKDLGVTIVELMPVYQRDPQDDDYWGYMPLNFFSAHHIYASRCLPCQEHEEFRDMVDALHAAGIEVVLDVVYNHTAEGDHHGPIYSYKGLDNNEYYMMSGDPAQPYANYSGTGNTLNVSSPYVRQMILDSLRYWRLDMGVDGFRFDLASAFSRNSDGSINWETPPIIGEIASDPELRNIRLIAEPWDAAGAYQLGHSFPGITWLQWNGRFRDDIRRFVKSDAGMVADLMNRLYGSADFFPDDRANAYHAYQSVNYITSHDGFTLYDLVAYNQKHNEANGENNRDGMDENYSWNCGVEGDEDVPAEVMALRRKQIRNFCCLLMLANGTPMFRAGDEFMQTQRGNNNPYNQDNETSWLDWGKLERNRDMYEFFRRMIAFRKAHSSLCRSRYWRDDVRWHGATGPVDMSEESHSLAFFLSGASQNDDDLYVLINAWWEDLAFTVQEGAEGQWYRVVDTHIEGDGGFVETGVPLDSTEYVVAPRSVVVLVRHVR